MQSAEPPQVLGLNRTAITELGFGSFSLESKAGKISSRCLSRARRWIAVAGAVFHLSFKTVLILGLVHSNGPNWNFNGLENKFSCMDQPRNPIKENTFRVYTMDLQNERRAGVEGIVPAGR